MCMHVIAIINCVHDYGENAAKDSPVSVYPITLIAGFTVQQSSAREHI